MSEYLTKLHMMEALLDDNVAVSAILASLGDEYENLIVAMKASDDEPSFRRRTTSLSFA